MAEWGARNNIYDTLIELYWNWKKKSLLWKTDLFGLTAFWNAPQKLTFTMFFSTLISKIYFFSRIFFFINSYYDLKLFIYYVFAKRLEL